MKLMSRMIVNAKVDNVHVNNIKVVIMDGKKMTTKYRVIRCTDRVIDDSKLTDLLHDGWSIISSVAVNKDPEPYIQYVLEKNDTK